MSWSRRWHRAASAVLLIAAGLHGVQHWHTYVASEPAQQAARAALQAYVLHAPLGITLWTATGFFSLAYAGLLALFGTTHLILAREADPRTLRRHALRNALLGAGITLAAAVLHPLPQGMLLFALATLLFGLAAWPRTLDR